MANNRLLNFLNSLPRREKIANMLAIKGTINMNKSMNIDSVTGLQI